MWGISTWCWPYVVIAMYNELNKVCIIYEAIMLAERTLMYTFSVNFMFTHTPRRRRDEVLVVSGDGFFSQTMLRNLGFQNAWYLRDCHYLFITGL
jgi:hypothetical protein